MDLIVCFFVYKHVLFSLKILDEKGRINLDFQNTLVLIVLEGKITFNCFTECQM